MWFLYLLIMLGTLLLRLSLHFNPLHYTCRQFTSSHLNFTHGMHYRISWVSGKFDITATLPVTDTVFLSLIMLVSNILLWSNNKLQRSIRCNMLGSCADGRVIASGCAGIFFIGCDCVLPIVTMVVAAASSSISSSNSSSSSKIFFLWRTC
jgi:hypothetical protein